MSALILTVFVVLFVLGGLLVARWIELRHYNTVEKCQEELGYCYERRDAATRALGSGSLDDRSLRANQHTILWTSKKIRFLEKRIEELTRNVR